MVETPVDPVQALRDELAASTILLQDLVTEVPDRNRCPIRARIKSNQQAIDRFVAREGKHG